MNVNKIRDAIVAELSKLPIPGDSILNISNGTINYLSGAKFPAPEDNRLNEGDRVKEISYELFDDEFYISINHSHGILDKTAHKAISTDELILISRRLKLNLIRVL